MIHENFTTGEKLPRWFKIAFKVGGPVMQWWSMSPSECGERVAFMVTGGFPARGGKDGKDGVATASDGAQGGGAYRVI